MTDRLFDCHTDSQFYEKEPIRIISGPYLDTEVLFPKTLINSSVLGVSERPNIHDSGQVGNYRIRVLMETEYHSKVPR